MMKWPSVAHDSWPFCILVFTISSILLRPSEFRRSVQLYEAAILSAALLAARRGPPLIISFFCSKSQISRSTPLFLVGCFDLTAEGSTATERNDNKVEAARRLSTLLRRWVKCVASHDHLGATAKKRILVRKESIASRRQPMLIRLDVGSVGVWRSSLLSSMTRL